MSKRSSKSSTKNKTRKNTMIEEIEVLIEVSKNSRAKYEFNKEKNRIELDRILHSAVFYPQNYGYMPNTLCGDGDALDILVLTSEPLQPGTYCYARPICHLNMVDEKGMDEKVLAVCVNDPFYNDIFEKEEVPQHVYDEIANFFENYKALEGDKFAKIKGWTTKQETQALIQKSKADYRKKNKK